MQAEPIVLSTNNFGNTAGDMMLPPRITVNADIVPCLEVVGGLWFLWFLGWRRFVAAVIRGETLSIQHSLFTNIAWI